MLKISNGSLLYPKKNYKYLGDCHLMIDETILF